MKRIMTAVTELPACLFRRVNRTLRFLKQEGANALVPRLNRRLGTKTQFLIVSLLMLIPAVVVLWYITEVAIRCPFWDEWNLVPLFDKLYTGSLSFADLFAQYHEHRILFPRIAILLLGAATHWNTVAECYLSWVFLCLTACVLLAAHVRRFGTTVTALASFIPVVWLLFNLRQSENLTWGFQVAFLMLLLFYSLSMYLLATSKGIGWRLVLSAACGMVATFSVANGLLVWPVGLIVIICLHRSQPRDRAVSYPRMALVWCAIAAATLIAYFVGYRYSEGLSEGYVHLSGVHGAYHSLVFFLATLGSPLSFGLNLAADKYIAVAAGALLLVLYICVAAITISQAKWRLSMPLSLSLILFSVASAVLLTLGRSGESTPDPLVSRYTTMTTPGIVGVYWAALSLEGPRVHVKAFLVGLLTCLIILGVTSPAVYQIRRVPDLRVFQNLGAYWVSTYRMQSDEILLRTYPSPQHLRELAETAERHRLTVYRNPRLDPGTLVPVKGSTDLAVFAINGDFGWQNPCIITDTQSFYVAGWAVDKEAGAAAGGVFVTIDGQLDVPAFYGLEMPEIAALPGNSGYGASGFTAWFATSLLGDGQHVLTFKVVTHDKTGYYQPPLEIVVVNE